MAEYKWTARFKYLSGAAFAGALNIPGGWSESVYYNSNSTATRNSFLSLCSARAAFLPNFCSIVGIRVQQVDPSGSGSLQRINYPGQVGGEYAQDIPQVAALFSIPSTGVSNVRRYRAAALPDDWVNRGEFTPGGPGAGILMTWLGRLHGWHARGSDLSVAKQDITTIASDGSYVLSQPLTVSVGAKVKIFRARDDRGRNVGGMFTIQAVTDTTHGILRAWPYGACTLGQIQLVTIIYPVMRTTGFDLTSVTVCVRKIGRPFVKYVGRRSRRRV